MKVNNVSVSQNVINALNGELYLDKSKSHFRRGIENLFESLCL